MTELQLLFLHSQTKTTDIQGKKNTELILNFSNISIFHPPPPNYKIKLFNKTEK